MIPEQLRKEEYRFIRVANKDKKPIDMGWQKGNNFQYNDQELKTHISNGGNYGVATGFGNLLVIDFDNQKFQELVFDKLPRTLSIKTSKGLHLYYECDNLESTNIKDTEKTLVDIQGIGKQVIGAGSTHPTGIKYEVLIDAPIAKIRRERIDAILNIETQKERISKKIKCPFHNDENASLMVYENGSFYCFGCESSGTKEALEKPEKAASRKTKKGKNYYYIKTKEETNKRTDQELKELKGNVIKSLIIGTKAEKQKITEEITQYITKHYYIYTTRNDEKNEMWIYKEGIYIPEAKTYIKEICRTILKIGLSSHLINEIILKIETDTYINQEDFFIVQDVNKIAVKNGLLNLKTRELEPFNPKYFFFNKINSDYKKESDCPKIKEFFKSILQDEKDVKVLQELFGYCLYRDYKHEKAFMFLGGGRNGKGKTNELLKRFIGIKNCSNISLQRIENDGFSISGLHNKMVNLSSDLSNTALRETGTFKQLTGHDMLSAQRKFLTDIEFTNYAKMIFSANELPITKDITLAFFNRWIIIDFPYTFLEKKDYELLKDKKNCKISDKEIIEKISTKEELDGLLNWSLEGLDQLEKNQCFSYSSSTEQTKNKWLRLSSSINAFIMDCVEEDYSNEITKQDFKNHYVHYCRLHKINPVNDKTIKEILSINLGVIDKKSSHDERPMVWVGIKFKSVQGVEVVEGFSTLGHISNSPLVSKKVVNLDIVDIHTNKDLLDFEEKVE